MEGESRVTELIKSTEPAGGERGGGKRGIAVVSTAKAAVYGAVLWMARHAAISFMLPMALTGLLGWAALKLEIRTNIEDLFPEDTPHVERAELARQKLATSSQILFVFASPDSRANEKFAQDLERLLLQDPEIESVDLKHDISFFRKNALLYLSTDELLEMEEKLRAEIRRAVSRELQPFDVEDEGDDEVAELSEDDFDEGFDEGFDKEEATPHSGGKIARRPKIEDRELFALPSESDIRRKYNVSYLSEYQSNPDKTIIGFKIFPTFAPAEVARSKELLDRIEGYVARLQPASYHPKLEWVMEGDYHSKIHEMEVIKKDLSKAAIFTLVLIVGLMLLYFAQLRALLLVFVPLGIGMVWTMGLAWLTIGYLNLVTAFIFAIMFGLGVDFAVHAVNRYMEERSVGQEICKALAVGLSGLGHAMVAAAGTTAVTFLSLVLFRFRGFSQFGLIAGLGVPVCLLAVYTTLPGLAVLLDKVWKEKPALKRFRGSSQIKLFGTRRRAGVVTVVVLCFILLMSGRAGMVEFESDMSKVMSNVGQQKGELMSRFRREVSARSTSPIVLLTNSQEQTRKVHEYIEAHRSDYEFVQDYTSIFSFVPGSQQEKLAIIQRMYKRLKAKIGAMKGEDLKKAKEALEYLEPSPFGVADLPDWVKERFTDRDGNVGHFLMLFAHGNKADARVVGRLLKELDVVKVGDDEFPTTASYFILKDAYDIVRTEGPQAALLAAVAVLAILLVNFRRVREVIAAFAPVVLSMGGYLGFMGWTGHNINMFNMIVLPTMLGMGVDTSIHLVHRMREAGPSSIHRVISTTGSAAGMSAATTAIGFGALQFSSNPGLFEIGLLAPVGILLCYLTALLLTPSMLTFSQR